MSDPRLNLNNWLPGMIGPLEVQVNGVPYAAQTFVWNFTGSVSVVFDPTYIDPQTPLNDDGTQTPIGRSVFSFSGDGGGSAPAMTGFATVTAGAFDTDATANLQYVGGKLQTKANIQWLNGTKTGDLAWTPTNARTITLPDATGTVVLKDTTDVLTNKTFDVAENALIATSQAVGDLLLNDGSTFNRVAKGANGTFLGVVGGVVGYHTPTSTAVPAKQQEVDMTSGNQTVDLGNGKIIKVIGTNAGTPVLTITPQPTSDALADSFVIRNPGTGVSAVNVTNALSGKTTMTLGTNCHAILTTTPDGIEGASFDTVSGGSVFAVTP